MQKTALLTGVTGQDGYYLSRLLVAKGYRVFGVTRDIASAQAETAELPISLISFDSRSTADWLRTIEECELDEVYHLAGVSFVPTSWAQPMEAISANLEVTVHILEALRLSARRPRLFYACSSEIFGQPDVSPQSETTPFRPLNPYGVTKAASFGMIESYRKRYGLFACSGILFNHESPRRASSFVTRKITQAAAAISLGLQSNLVLGNLDVARDWGYAAEYVECMVRMLQADVAEDFVIGSGRLSRLELLVQTAFDRVGLDWKQWVSIDPKLVRANESRALVADSSKALRLLDWQAETSIESLIEAMVDHDIALLGSAVRQAA